MISSRNHAAILMTKSRLTSKTRSQRTNWCASRSLPIKSGYRILNHQWRDLFPPFKLPQKYLSYLLRLARYCPIQQHSEFASWPIPQYLAKRDISATSPQETEFKSGKLACLPWSAFSSVFFKVHWCVFLRQYSFLSLKVWTLHDK